MKSREEFRLGGQRVSLSWDCWNGNRNFLKQETPWNWLLFTWKSVYIKKNLFSIRLQKDESLSRKHSQGGPPSVGPPIPHWKPRHLHYKPCKYVEAGKVGVNMWKTYSKIQSWELSSSVLYWKFTPQYLCVNTTCWVGAPLEFQLPA